TAEPLSMAETLETHLALRALGLNTAAVVFNRVSPAAFETGDVVRLMRRCAHMDGLRNTDRLEEIARRELKRRARERRAYGILVRRVGCPLIELEEHRGLPRRALTEALAAQLARDDADAEPRDEAASLKTRHAPG
ncbi:MAG: hypothetical protein ACREQN_13060, partial [Candidatus Binataceae bacterium]